MKVYIRLFIICITLILLGIGIGNAVWSNGSLLTPILIILAALFIINSQIK